MTVRRSASERRLVKESIERFRETELESWLLPQRKPAPMSYIGPVYI